MLVTACWCPIKQLGLQQQSPSCKQLYTSCQPLEDICSHFPGLPLPLTYWSSSCSWGSKTAHLPLSTCRDPKDGLQRHFQGTSCQLSLHFKFSTERVIRSRLVCSEPHPLALHCTGLCITPRRVFNWTPRQGESACVRIHDIRTLLAI